LEFCGVQSGHAGEPAIKPSLLCATIRGPFEIAQSSRHAAEPLPWE